MPAAAGEKCAPARTGQAVGYQRPGHRRRRCRADARQPRGRKSDYRNGCNDAARRNSRSFAPQIRVGPPRGVPLNLFNRRSRQCIHGDPPRSQAFPSNVANGYSAQKRDEATKVHAQWRGASTRSRSYDGAPLRHLASSSSGLNLVLVRPRLSRVLAPPGPSSGLSRGPILDRSGSTTRERHLDLQVRTPRWPSAATVGSSADPVTSC